VLAFLVRRLFSAVLVLFEPSFGAFHVPFVFHPGITRTRATTCGSSLRRCSCRA
jgi:hypothetical protein